MVCIYIYITKNKGPKLEAFPLQNVLTECLEVLGQMPSCAVFLLPEKTATFASEHQRLFRDPV